MASPQIENGHTRIANELLKIIIKYMVNPSWLRVSLLTIRITYGFHRTKTMSNYPSFLKWLNLTDEYLKQVLSEMKHAKVIHYDPKDSFKFEIGLNKNYEEWNICK